MPENFVVTFSTLRSAFGSIARFLFVALFLLGVRTASAQDERVTLVLKGGGEVQCTVHDIWQGEVYFEAASARDAYKYGEVISLEKIESVRLSRNRVIAAQDYAAHWRGETVPQAEQETPAAQPVVQTPPPRESGPGIRLQSVNIDTARIKKGIGIRYPEMPRTESAATLDYAEVADLLAESGMAGKLLYEVSAGGLRRRELTKNQKQLVDALLQSQSWGVRKRELRSAHMRAAQEFDSISRTLDRLFETLRFRPSDAQYAFLEFVQFLHAENAHKFLDKWQRIEDSFSAEGALALRDVLNNYDDWYYLYGQEIEKRSRR